MAPLCWGRVLRAVLDSDHAPAEIIVVDNGSTDRSGEIARQYGAQVIQTAGQHCGPAHARNRGAAIATGDILLFIDADVAVHPDAIGLVEQTLSDHPEIAAVFGSYDDDPPGSGLASQYKNLLHHYVHQHGHRESSTFWTGCGAIRREVFLDIGGFDEHYTRPSIEDIDLGARLRRAGRRVWLCPEIQATHLKRWTLRQLLHTDIHDRAVPWTRLILREAYLPGDLNLDLRSRLSAILAWLLIFSVAAALWSPYLLPLVALTALGLAALNAGLYRFFIRQGGLRFGLGASGLHVLYLLYGSLIFAMLATRHFFSKRPAHHWALVMLLLVTFLKGWLWSAAIPMWQSSDEDRHFGYAQEIVRQQTWPLTPPQAVPIERSLSWELMDPLRLSGQREPLDLSPAGLQRLRDRMQQLNDPAVRTDLVPPVAFTSFLRQHPPLYYTLAAFMYQLNAGENIFARLAGMRLLSVMIAVATVVCAYGAARALWPEQTWLPLAVATLVSFQPLFTFYTATLTNAALEILCYAALTWQAIIIMRRGMNWRRGAILGGILTAGLLTKSSFLPAVLLVALLLIWDILRSRSRTHIGGWLIAIGLPVALAGWWYVGFLMRGSSELADIYLTSSVPQSVPLLPYLLHYPWLTRYLPFLNEWWGVFGTRDTFMAQPVYIGLRILILAALLGWVWRGLRGWRTRSTPASPTALTLGMGLILTLSLIAFYTALDYQLAQSGSAFKIQGRYFLSPLVAQMLLLVIGWTALLRGRRWMLLALCLGMIALNTYALLGVILPALLRRTDRRALRTGRGSCRVVSGRNADP